MKFESYVFPCEIEEDIRAIGGAPIPYMRTAAFSAVVKEIEAGLLELAGCRGGRAIIFTASGTGAMDSVVTNYVSAKGKAFVIVGGSFGRRWRDLCVYYGVEHETMDVDFCRDPDYDELERRLGDSGAKVLLCHHHETSTGEKFDLDRISTACRKHGVSLATDAVSSFLSEPLDMDKTGIDIMVTSTQKGLNISPGLSIVLLSKRLEGFEFAHRSYYFDYEDNLRNLTRGQTPFSPATTIFLQLQERVRRLLATGGAEANIERVARRAKKFRELCDRYGWERPAQTPANCITGFFVRRNGDRLFEEMMKRGYYIMPGGTPCYFRVAHLGEQSDEQLERLAAAIREIELTDYK